MYEKSKEYIIEQGGKVKKFVELHKLNTETAMYAYIKDWIRNVQYFIKNQKNFVENDIRKYIKVKN